VCEAIVTSDLRGYQSLLGWVQLVGTRDAPATVDGRLSLVGVLSRESTIGAWLDASQMTAGRGARVVAVLPRCWVALLEHVDRHCEVHVIVVHGSFRFSADH